MCQIIMFTNCPWMYSDDILGRTTYVAMKAPIDSELSRVICLARGMVRGVHRQVGQKMMGLVPSVSPYRRTVYSA